MKLFGTRLLIFWASKFLCDFSAPQGNCSIRERIEIDGTINYTNITELVTKHECKLFQLNYYFPPNCMYSLRSSDILIFASDRSFQHEQDQYVNSLAETGCPGQAVVNGNTGKRKHFTETEGVVFIKLAILNSNQAIHNLPIVPFDIDN